MWKVLDVRSTLVDLVTSLVVCIESILYDTIKHLFMLPLSSMYVQKLTAEMTLHDITIMQSTFRAALTLSQLM